MKINGSVTLPMKTTTTIGLALAAVLVTVIIEETRMAGLRRELERPARSAPASAPPVSARASTPGDGSGREPQVHAPNPARSHPAPATTPPEHDGESMAKTMRRMLDNPAGKSMMNQGIKIAVAMMYEDFIDSLELTKEEADYFKNLLGEEMANQQEFGMKLMSADAGERKALLEEMEKRNLGHDEAIKTFLNNDEDYQSFTAYKSRLPERQQLDGIRATMASKGAPLDAETESRLIEAMHQVRTESKGPDLNGPDALREIAKGNIVEAFEESWRNQQDALRAATAEFLSPAQREAFEEYQKNMKEMQLISIKMAEKMFSEGGSAPPGAKPPP